MPHVNYALVLQVMLPSIFAFFFIFALIATVVAAGLIFRSQAMLGVFRTMNRYVSTRKAGKELSVSRDSGQTVMKYRHWFSAFFVLGAAYAEFGLITQVNDAQVVHLLNLALPNVATTVLVHTARVFLMAGGVFSIFLGLLLVFSPGAVGAMERWGNRWYSSRKMGMGSETMHLTLDNWVLAFPRASGWIIVFPALALVLYFGFMLFGRA